MITNDVSFILSFVILMAKIWIFGFSPGVCPTESSNLVFSLECLVSNGRQALLWGIKLGGSATSSSRSCMCLMARGNESSSSIESDSDNEMPSYDEIMQQNLNYAKVCTSQQKKLKKLKEKLNSS